MRSQIVKRLACPAPRVVTVCLAILVIAGPVNAEDWPWFLGPQHTGVSTETGIHLDWTSQPPAMLWKQPIGTGYSAPSVMGDRLVIHHRVDDTEVISCRKVSDGAEIWKQSYKSSFADPYGYNNGPRCSPVLTETNCYTLGAEGMLTCVSMQDGEIVWQRDLQRDFDLPEWFFGMGCSPLLDGDRLIVLVGGQPNSGVVAFDISTGNTIWQAVGKDTWDGSSTDVAGKTYQWSGDEMVVSYSSPIIAEIHGQRHLLCQVRQGLVSLNPATGEENFHYWFRPRVHESVNAAVPVVIDDRIFLSAAYQLGSVLLQVKPDGKGLDVIWRDPRNMLAHWSTPIHVDGFIYGFSGRHENEGELRCISLQDGKIQWKTDGFGGDISQLARDRETGHIIDTKSGRHIPYPYFGRGSMIQLGDRFIVLGERGTLSVVSINQNEFKEYGRTSYDEIHYPAWAAPVLSNKRLYLRSEDWLVCLDVSRPEGAE
ncbi:MAG: PQQ-binding-like beta-propeller repeat protein [Planctomycetaceae bacterium]